MRRTRLILGCFLAVLLTSASQALAECYTCAITTQGITYCKSKTSGYAFCNAGVNWCSAEETCGSGGGFDPEEPIVRNRCGASTPVLTAVAVPRAQQAPELVLAAVSPVTVVRREVTR